MSIRTICYTLSLSAIALLGVAQFSHSNVLPAYAADSYEKLSNYATSSLTKTIDLNPVGEADIRSYYAALEGKSLQGDDLLKALKPILSNGQQYFNYDTNSAIWQMYEITDRDWSLSPASEITNGTYDASTGIISNYKYGTNANKGDNPYLRVLYRNEGVVEGRLRAWDHHGDNKGIDREHIWPKSRGFGKDADGVEHKVSGARGDPHHLLPGDSHVNSALHSNNSYGFVDRSKPYEDGDAGYKIDNVTVVAGNLLGVSATFGNSIGNEKVFEPQDCDKGDIARACFYMVARYNNLAGNDDTIDAGNPNLFLSDESISTATVMSDKNNAVSIGILRDLLAWHQMDPVDEYEIHRNDLVYRNYGKNRNPFIDFPEWVNYVWGTVEVDEDAHKVTSYSRVPTGSAKPSQDPLNSYAPKSPVVSIAVENQKTEQIQGEKFVFGGKVIATHEDGSHSNVTSSCTFSGYDLSKQGKQTVTVTHVSGVTTTYEIIVNAKPSIPLPILIGAGVVAVIILIVLLIAIKRGSAKTKRAARKVVKGAVKNASKSRSSSRKKK